MLVSGGDLVLADTTPTFARTTYYPNTGVGLLNQFATYGEIYRKQLWVNVLVNKRALGTARLPRRVYRRLDDLDREEARDTPYAQLLRNPNPKLDPFFFWTWTSSTFDIYGEFLWVKVRDRTGKPVELWPIHPSNVSTRNTKGVLEYLYLGGASSSDPLLIIPATDVVHAKTYNPMTTVRGLSRLEPLRQTLSNEDASRRATFGFWKNGARPAIALVHPKTLSDNAAKRLRSNWDAIHAGADSTGATAVLEEGIEPKIIPLNLEEAQYIESRKLNREEVCAEYDTPPPVVHILDHATYSNITEQMRSMYRDTMAPHLGGFESVLDAQLRPDFGEDDLYAEFYMDHVLRGDPEKRAESNLSAINSGQMTPNEARREEGRPSLPGGDRLYMNSTMIPIDEVSSRTSPNPPAEDVPGAKPAVEEAPTTAPALIPRATPSVQSPPPAKSLTTKQLRDVMGRLSRIDTLECLEVDRLLAGLDPDSTDAVLRAVGGARNLRDLRARLKAAAEAQGSPHGT